MKSKRIISLIVGISLLVTAALTGCGSKSAESTTESSAVASSSQAVATQSEEKKESVTMSVFVTKDWYDDSTKWLLEDYQAKSGNKLDIQIVPGGQQFNDSLTAKAAINELPDIMFMYSSSGWLKTMQADQLLVDLTNEPYISKISPSILNDKGWLRFNDKIYAIPTGGLNVAGVIYNKDLFTKNNIEIPKTYDEFMAICEKFKGMGITPIFEAIKDGWPLQLFNFIGQSNEFTKNPEILNSINAGTFDITKSEGAKKALTRQHELYTKGYLNKDVASATYDMQIAAFAAGKTAMFVQADWAIPTLLEKFPDAASFTGMFVLPWDENTVVPVDAQRAISISKNSKNVEAAKGFLTYATSEETLNSFYGKLKSVPCYTGIKADLNPGTADMVQFVDAGKTNPFPSLKWITGIEVSFDLPGTILGSKSIEMLLKEAQAKYIKSGKDNKVAGF